MKKFNSKEQTNDFRKRKGLKTIKNFKYIQNKIYHAFPPPETGIDWVRCNTCKRIGIRGGICSRCSILL